MNKKYLKLISCIVFLSALNANAQNNCFIALENNQIIEQIGKCKTRHTPASTFKIALALMGFDSGILISPDEPLIEFTKERRKRIGKLYYPKKFPNMLWSELPQTPSSWMFNSVIWYSQEITEKLGEKRFEEYTKKLNYGNMNVSGSPKENNGLLRSWIYSSLKISPLEQVNFLNQLSRKELPLSIQAQENTIAIIKLENINDGWLLYGKTGGGKTGWFVGWVEKDNRRIVFAQYFEPKCNPLSSAGKIAKELAKENLVKLMCVKCVNSFKQYDE